MSRLLGVKSDLAHVHVVSSQGCQVTLTRREEDDVGAKMEKKHHLHVQSACWHTIILKRVSSNAFSPGPRWPF